MFGAFDIAVNEEIVNRKNNIKRSAGLSIGLVRLTKDALDKLQESLEEVSRRISLLDLVRKTFLTADYLIAIAVPEYPYLMLSSLYRSVPDAQKILSLATEEGFVYDLAKKIAQASIDELNAIIWNLKKEISQLLQLKEKERKRFNIYSALFSEILFLDEFHTWTMYERPTVLALILLHYLESLRTPKPERYKIILSSATPQNEFYTLLEKLGLGSIKIIRAKLLHNETNADRVKSKTINLKNRINNRVNLKYIIWNFLYNDNDGAMGRHPNMVVVADPNFFGSSRNSGKSSPDLEEEVLVIPEAVSHSFNHLDFIVNPFHQAGVEVVFAVGQDAGHIGFKALGETS